MSGPNTRVSSLVLFVKFLVNKKDGPKALARIITKTFLGNYEMSRKKIQPKVQTTQSGAY